MGATVLYIEDNPDNMLLVRRALESRGYTFLWAANGVRGLEEIQARRPDAVLLDINLPDMDGYEVARRLRADERYKSLPIIAITANALKGDSDKAIAAGCNQYMSKPINIRDLWTRLAEILS
ncbi:MAG: response regulator [Chloroflexi bacterium]|nr:response regulator [Chloroflexota bacterium]MBI5080836.1 response regulator [Chloroflexota bacterium]MBI5348115.1 response regulator [Chloroflexota bacterium]